MVTKAIEPGQVQLDLYKADLKLTSTNSTPKPKTEPKVDEGGEEVPWHVFLGHEWEGHSFNELVILTPDV